MMDGKKILGGFLILIAVISILGFVNIVDAGAIFSTYWPVVIMLAGVAQMINKNLIGGGIVLLFGIWFQLDKLGFNTIHYMWPLLLIAAGVSLIAGRGKTGDTGTIVSAASAANAFTACGRSKRSFAIDACRGGRITTLCGGSEIDLSRCVIIEEAVHLEVNTLFGGCALFVPASWQVRISGFPIFGSHEEKGEKAAAETAPVVIVHCFTAFASLEIYYQ